MGRFCLKAGVVSLALLLSGCRAHHSAAEPFTAEITGVSSALPGPALSGKLYVSGNHLRADWGPISDVFDLKTRTGWRIFPDTKKYERLTSKDLSTYAPEMENGSLCPHATFPSSCNLLGDEVVEGRSAKKWDLYNPQKNFHVYFWTDEAQAITLRMEIGDEATYKVSHVRADYIPESTFQIPAGFEKIENLNRPER